MFKNLSELLSPDALTLLSANGNALVEEIGIDIVRGVVLDVLSGENLRNATETLTRRRIAALNLAIVNMFLEGMAASDNFIEQLPNLATKNLSGSRISKTERWLAYWILGLTHKAYQNVLRDNLEQLDTYRAEYIQICREVIENHTQKYGELTGTIQLPSGLKAEVNWQMLTYLLNTIGAETLAIRGSEKSAYGKLFEKLILGSLLHILGFKYIPETKVRNFNRVFWLSSRGNKRESDATLLYAPGKAIRFDIGFIGKGNTEISLDKVSRFEKHLELNNEHWYVQTIIIVDRIGPRSNIVELAKAVDGIIVQMSGAYWPKQIAHELNRTLGFKHPLLNMDQAQIREFLAQRITSVPLEEFLGLVELSSFETDDSDPNHLDHS